MGKARRIQTSADRLRKNQIQIKELQSQFRNRNTPRPVASTAFAGVSAAGDIGGVGNFLRTAGDSMIGPFALSPPVDFTIDIDGSNTIDIGESSSNSQYSSNIQLEDVPTSTTLDIIKGAALDGQILVIRTFAPNPITIRQATLANGGNIQTSDDNDLVLGDLQVIELIFDDKLIVFGNTGGTWRITTPVSGGGGGISLPLNFTEDDRGPVGVSPQNILFSASTRHSIKMVISVDMVLSFNSPPTNETAYSNIIIVQDGTGNHTLTLPPGTVNKDIVEAGFLLGADLETGIVIKFAFGVFYAFLETGNIVSGGGSPFSGNLSDLVIDVTKNWDSKGVLNFGSIAGVTGITGTGSSVVISGIETYDFFQVGQSIQNKADPDGGLLYNVDELQSHIFRADGSEIAKFEETTLNVFRLNMLNHSIRDALDITFPNNAGATVFAGNTPAIGFDSIASRLLINYPTGASIFVTENNIIGSTQIKSDSLGADVVNASKVLQLGVDITVPTVSGEFRNDGTDVTVFSGGNVRNLSNIPIGISATTELDNLTTTSINATLLPQASATIDLGSELLPWRIGHFREIEFSVDASVPSGITDTQIAKNSSGNMAFNNAAAGGGYLFYFEGVNKWGINSTALSGDNIILEESLVFNDSATNPVGDGEFTRNGDSMILQTPKFQIQRDITGTFSGELDLVKVNATPSGGEPIYKINFSLFDSPVTTVYSQIRSEIRDVTDAGRLYLSVRADNTSLVDAIEIIGDDNNLLSFININARITSDLIFGVESGATDLVISPSVNNLGFSVKSGLTSSNIGSLGSIVGPLSVGASPAEPTSDAAADALFGSLDGSWGVSRQNTLTNAKFWVKADNGWQFIEMTDAF